jgi:hypothetical protein
MTQSLTAAHTEHESSQNPISLISKAIQSNISVDQLSALLDLQQRYERDQARKEYYRAFARFQSECPEIQRNITKNYTLKTAGKVTLNYADLPQIAKVIRAPLQNNGLSYRWETKIENGMPIVTCYLSHVDGYSESSTLQGPPDTSGGKAALHAMASTISYLKRYTLTSVAALSTAEFDDDGDLASEKSDKEEKEKTKTPYPDDRLRQNYNDWQERVKSGNTTPEEIIKMIETRATLTDVQKDRIRGL